MNLTGWSKNELWQLSKSLERKIRLSTEQQVTEAFMRLKNQIDKEIML